MDAETRKKTMEKIAKCLRLSKSANSNEAATALRQAQKMMEAHGVTEEDIDGMGYGNEAVDVPIQKQKQTPIALSRLLDLIDKAFGVSSVIESRIGISDISYRIRYFGPLHRVTMAGYAHQVVYRAMESAWKEELKNKPEVRGARGYRAGFQIGWLDAVTERVEAIGFTTAEKVGTQIAKDKLYGKKELTTVMPNKMRVSGSMLNSGADAAKNFSIHRPMDSNKKLLT